MTVITRYNYEEFFLDYLDGTLSSLQQITLEEFLDKNPDLKLELEEMECPVLSKDSVPMNFESLKEIPFRKNFDDFCIARLEGDLSADNELAFDTFLEKNESFKKEHQSYQKTIFVADNNLVCPDKNKLKRSSRTVAFWWYFSRIGVAASIILLFSLWSILYQFEGDYSKEEKISAKIETVTTERNEIIERRASNEVETAVIPEQKELEPEGKISQEKSPQEEPGNQLKEIKVQEIEEILERVEPLTFSYDTKLIAISNSENPTIELDIPKEEKLEINSQNNGLAQLGMSWKSSVPKKNAQNSVLYAIAKYGVDKLGEIAGKNIQLEKKYNSTTEKTRLDFNTAGIGFSKTIK